MRESVEESEFRPGLSCWLKCCGVSITVTGFPSTFEGAKADADLTEDAQQTRTSSIRLADQLDCQAPLDDAG